MCLGISAILQKVVTTVNMNKGAGHFPVFYILLQVVVLVIVHHKLFDTLFSYKAREAQL